MQKHDPEPGGQLPDMRQQNQIIITSRLQEIGRTVQAPTTSKVVRPVRSIHQGANHE